MGYKSSFLDNEIYGADDISAAFSRILTSGVLVYPERETVADSLNEMTSEVVDAGVTDFGGLEVSRTETGAKVGQGTAFFESGVAVVVDSEGATVDFEEGTAVYIYFIYQPEFNSVLLKATEELPDGDTLVLAYIDADGNISDRRSYASAKMMVNTTNMYYDFTMEHTRWSSSLSNIIEGSQTVHKMPHNGFSYLLIMGGEFGKSVTYAPKNHIIDLNVEGRQSVNLNDYSTQPSLLYIERNGTELTLTTVYRSGVTEGYKNTLYLKLV